LFENEAVAVALWQAARVPRGFTELWCEELDSVAGLAALRRRLRSSLTGRATGDHADRDHWSERLVLVADELTSNALRHGGGPVAAALSRVDDEWLVSVSDHAPDVPPAPAQGRDPVLGGLGLYLVADLSVRHGWFAGRRTKTVWAVVAGGPAPA
jgi:signal transduction histidine kinase